FEIMDACTQTWSLAAADAVLASIDLIAARAAALPDGSGKAAAGAYLAAARFRRWFAFGMKDRALPWLEEEERLTAPLGSAWQPNAWFERLSWRLSMESYEDTERRAQEWLQQLGDDPRSRRHRSRLQLVCGIAQAMRGDATAAAATLAAVQAADPSPGEWLRAQMHLAALALQQGRQADFLALTALPPSRAAAVREPGRRASLEGLLLRRDLLQKSAAGDLERHRAALATTFEQLLANVAAIEPRLGGVGFFHFGESQQVLADLVEAELACRPGPAG